MGAPSGASGRAGGGRHDQEAPCGAGDLRAVALLAPEELTEQRAGHRPARACPDPAGVPAALAEAPAARGVTHRLTPWASRRLGAPSPPTPPTIRKSGPLAPSRTRSNGPHRAVRPGAPGHGPLARLRPSLPGRVLSGPAQAQQGRIMCVTASRCGQPTDAARARPHLRRHRHSSCRSRRPRCRSRLRARCETDETLLSRQSRRWSRGSVVRPPSGIDPGGGSH